MLAEYTPLTDSCKAKGLKGRKDYYYVFFIGTLPSEQGKGLCSALMRKYQSQARKEGVPVWLEATTAYSRDLYLKLGFKTIDEMVLGKGSAATDGTACKGGEGVKIWGMIWEPEAQPALGKS
jgi:N-acetylglutamate synthase-like GNAT family acetyltransferase